MEKIKYAVILIAFMVGFMACDDQLDIIPKGKTTLESVTDLEMLLNREYIFNTDACVDLGMICNESLGQMSSVPEMLSLTNTLSYAYLSYDETVDRVTLAQDDGRYAAAYSYINYMNIVIDKMPEAEGDESIKPALVAEARIIRAYIHWLLVNIHATQYEESTASTDGGIAYCDNTDVSEQKTKLTVEETYRRILEDCSDEVINLLPASDGDNVLRADRAFGNAVRAKVLMQMKRYDEALPYALQALSLNGKIEDRSIIMETYAWTLQPTIANNYVYMRGGIPACPTLEILSRESSVMFEEGDYVADYEGGWNEMFGMMFSGIEGCKMYFGWATQANSYGINSDRMYYTAAECYIRTGEIRKGLELVDRVRNYRVEDYQSYTELYDTQPLSEEDAISLMQKSKWVECIGSYENFFDCKRWNSETKYSRTITRDLGEYGSYFISPNSPLWILPFPANATRYNKSLTQNFTN